MRTKYRHKPIERTPEERAAIKAKVKAQGSMVEMMHQFFVVEEKQKLIKAGE